MSDLTSGQAAPSKELATTSTQLTTPGNVIGRGFEKVDLRKITMPRVKVMQGLSPELADEDYNFKQGDIIHGLLMEKMPDKFIPLSVWDSNILFLPRDTDKRKALCDRLNIDDTESGFIICRADDGREGTTYGSCKACGMCDFHDDEPPVCTRTINVLALFDGWQMPVVISFANTSWKYGRRFRDMAVFSGGDIFSKKYKLKSSKTTNDKGVFFVIEAKPGGLPDEAERGLAEAMYTKFSGVIIQVDGEPDDFVAAEPQY